MANPDTPNGFKPVVGNGTTARIRTYKVAAGYASAIGVGGPVILVAGYVQQAASPLATAKSLLGVSAEYVAATGVEREIKVYDDPSQLYEAQFDDNTITTEAQVVGNNFGITGVALISTVTGQSQVELDGNVSGASSLTNIFHTIAVSGRIDNDISLANARVYGLFGQEHHVFSAETAADLAA